MPGPRGPPGPAGDAGQPGNTVIVAKTIVFLRRCTAHGKYSVFHLELAFFSPEMFYSSSLQLRAAGQGDQT